MTKTAKAIPTNILIDVYLQYSWSYSIHTNRARKSDLSTFVYDIEKIAKRVSYVYELTPSIVERFIQYRLGIESPQTVSRRIATIKGFISWCVERFDDFEFSVKRIRDLEAKPKLRTGVSDDDISLMKEALLKHRNDDFYSFRLLIIFELMRLQGLRVFEVKNIMICQLDGNPNMIMNLVGKGRKTSHIELHSYLLPLLKEYRVLRDLELRKHDAYYHKRRTITKGRYPLIISTSFANIGEPESYKINEKTIWKQITKLGESCGVSNFHPHRLRHTCAKKLLEITKNIVLVSQELRHSNINTTMKYLNDTTDERRKAREAMK